MTDRRKKKKIIIKQTTRRVFPKTVTVGRSTARVSPGSHTGVAAVAAGHNSAPPPARDPSARHSRWLLVSVQWYRVGRTATTCLAGLVIVTRAHTHTLATGRAREYT